MPPNDPNNVGNLKVTITADPSGLNAGLKAAESQVASSSARMTGGVESVGKGLKGLIQPISAVVSALTRVAGIVGIVTSAAYAAAAPIRAAVEEIYRAREAMNKLTEARDAAGDSPLAPGGPRSTEALASWIRKYEEGVAKAEALAYQLRANGDLSTKQLNEQLDLLKNQRAAMLQLARVQQERIDREEDFRKANAASVEMQLAKTKELEEAAARKADTERQLNEDMKEFWRLSQRAYQDATAAQERMRDEARAAAAEQRAFVRSMRDEIRSAFPAEKIISDMGRIVAALEQIKQQRGR